MKTFSTILIVSFFTISIKAQVGIGTTSPNAQLDIKATNQATPVNTDGILIPKIDAFPTVNPTALQDGMLVFITGNGAPSKGFYFWNQTTTSWVAIAAGTITSEWTDNGTYLTPTDGGFEDITIGGVDDANTRLTVRSNKQRAGLFRNEGTQDGSMVGIETQLNNNSTNVSSFTIGSNNFVFNSGAGITSGAVNYVLGDGNGNHFGVESRLVGNGSGDHYGLSNTFMGTGSGFITGVYNNILVDEDGSHTGVLNSLTGDGDGARYGTNNIMIANANGAHYGTSTYIVATETSNASHYGSWVNLSSNGNGNRIGSYSILQGTGNGNFYGNQIAITNGGSGTHYGAYNSLIGVGAGNKYGTYNYISNTAGGTHYGVYSEALKSGSYAGYFLGTVAVGTTPSDTYVFPSSRGTNGQVLQSDSAGNLSWINPVTSDTSPAWYNESTTTNAISTGTDIIRSGNVGLGVTNANYKLDIYDSRGTAALYIGMDDVSATTNTISYGIRTAIDNDNNGLSTGDSYSIENTLNVLSDNGIGIRNNITGHLGGASTIYGAYNLMNNNGSGDAYGTYNSVGGISGINYGSYNTVTGLGYGVYASALSSGAYAGYFLGAVAIGTTTSNTYTFPSSRGTNNQVLISNGSGVLSWVDGSSIAAQKIDDLSDGKSDSDGSQDGSSVFLGDAAGLFDDSTDNRNVGMGYNALRGNTSGAENVAIGYESRLLSNSGTGNVSLGYHALYNVNGDGNIAIGRSAHIGNADMASNNISIGSFAGSGLATIGPFTPSGNILIGTNVNPYSVSGSNQMNIGNFLFANTINGSSVGGYFTGNLGVGYYNPTSTLHIGGDIRMDYTSNGNHWRVYIDGVNDYNFEYNGLLKSYIQDTDGSYNIFSDARLKNNIQSISSDLLPKILKLNPVTYVYKDDKTNTNQYGFIAQEVKKLFPELVHEKTTQNENYLSLNYQAFSVMAIKTIQEQQKEIENLKNEVSKLKELEERITKLEMN